MVRSTSSTLRLAPMMGLVTLGAFFLTVGRVAHTSSTQGCIKCQIDGCHLEAFQFTNPLGTDFVDTCVDFDGVPPGHCAVTERQHEEIVQATAQHPDVGTVIGDCFMELCSGASPIPTRPCVNPLQVGSAQAMSVSAADQSGPGCPLNP